MWYEAGLLSCRSELAQRLCMGGDGGCTSLFSFLCNAAPQLLCLLRRFWRGYCLPGDVFAQYRFALGG
jgi:hypothetical protein